MVGAKGLTGDLREAIPVTAVPRPRQSSAARVDAAIDSSGNLFIADQTNSVIRRVDPSGVISTFAGGGTVDLTTASPPSEVPATKARFQSGGPAQIEVDSAGNVLIADEKGHRVWKIDPSGNLAAFAGTGQPGFSGDGGPADKAQLNGPYGLAIDGEDNVFIGDYENSRIRRVDPDGTITTVAGNGEVGTGGDGGPATEAQLRVSIRTGRRRRRQPLYRRRGECSHPDRRLGWHHPDPLVRRLGLTRRHTLVVAKHLSAELSLGRTSMRPREEVRHAAVDARLVARRRRRRDGRHLCSPGRIQIQLTGSP